MSHSMQTQSAFFNHAGHEPSAVFAQPLLGLVVLLVTRPKLSLGQVVSGTLNHAMSDIYLPKS